MQRRLRYVLKNQRGEGYVDVIVHGTVRGDGSGLGHAGTSCVYPKTAVGYLCHGVGKGGGGFREGRIRNRPACGNPVGADRP